MSREWVTAVVEQEVELTPGVRSDEALLAAYQVAGDRRAFDELVHRYEHELFNYLCRYLGDTTAAEDAFQATFLQVHLKCQQFESGRKVRPWLYTIATNQAIDSQRRNKRHKMASLDRPSGKESDDLHSLLALLASRDSSPMAQMEDEERHRWVRQAVADLPEPLRIALTLIYYQGLKYREAAEALGVPVGTVKSRVHAALLSLNHQYNALTMSSAS